MRKVFILGILLFCAYGLKAQYFETGVEPFSVKWRQISKGKIRLIYPLGTDSIAQNYLSLLSVTDTLLGKDYCLGVTKLSVVLHPNTTLSNGFVAWAPRRMELITHPAYGGYAQPWSQQLAIHEMRHVKQLFALNRNTVKFASYLFGQQATGLAAGFVPMWYLEGDAVAAETAFSHSGRSRTANFYQHYRAHLLSNSNNYGYDKWLLGSYKNYIPNHYSLGYQIVAYGNLKYGSNIWANTIDYVSRKPYTIFPFYFGLKKETGLSRKSLSEQAFAYQDSIWTNSENSQVYDKIDIINNKHNEYANYLYPYILNDSTILAYKTSLKDIPAFISVDTRTGTEKVLTYPGYLLGKPFINDTLIVWAEYKPHTRWEYKSYGQINVFNIRTSSKKTISRKGMLGSPVVHPVNGEIYCLEYLSKGQSQLINLTDSKISPLYIFDYSIEPFELIVDPKNPCIYAGVVTPNGKEIWKLEGDNHSKIFGPTFMDINSIQIKGDSLFFSASSSIKEEIYYTNLLNNKTYRLINSIYSLNYFSNNQQENTTVSAYTENGYRIGRVGNFGTPIEVNIQSSVNDNYTSALAGKVGVRIDTLKINSIFYPSKPYRGLGTLFNVHSWAPFYFNPYNTNPEESKIKHGATVMSQNLTGSTVMVLGYGYGTNHLVNANIRYAGFWPVFSFGFEQFDETAWLYRVNTYDVPNKHYRNRFKLFSYLPFTLSKNSYYTYLQIFNSSERTNDYLFDDKIVRYKSGLFTMNNGLYFRATRSMAHRDLLPRLGIEFTAMHVNAPYNRNNIGNLSAIKSTLYLPGVWQNQHLKLSASLQKQGLKRYYLSNKIDAPRGYNLYRSENFRGFSMDYLMPIAYPDRAIGSLTYIKRFSLDIFFDYAKNTYPAKVNNQIVTWNENMQSVGFEVNIDLHFLRTRYPFRIKYQQAFTGNNFAAFSNLSMVYDIYGGFNNRTKHIEH